MESQSNNPFSNKHSPTKRAPNAGDSGAIPSLFLRLSLFPVGRRPAARPSAGNANRCAAPPSHKPVILHTTKSIGVIYEQ